MDDKKTTIEDLKKLVADFRDERNWNKHHNPKSLSISIAVEAAELLEHFQWDNESRDQLGEIKDELADIIIYCLFLADNADIDVSKAVQDKLKKAGKKYPVEMFQDQELGSQEYYKAKLDYRKK